MAVVRDENDLRLLPHETRRQRPTVMKATEMKALTKEVRFCADIENVKTRHVIFVTFPCVKTTSLGQDAHMATNAVRHVEAEEKPSKKSKKGGAKGSVVLFKESTQLGCASQGSYRRKSILREEGKLGSKNAVKFSKGTWHHRKISGQKGSIARNYSKV